MTTGEHSTNGLTPAMVRGFLENTEHGVAVYDQAARWRYLNDAGIQFFGRPLGDIVGTELPPDTRLIVTCPSEPGDRGNFALPLTRWDNAVREVTFDYRGISVDGEIVGLAAARDVTSHKRRAREAAALIRIASESSFDRSLRETLDFLATVASEATGAVNCMLAVIEDDPPRMSTGGASWPAPEELWRAIERTWGAGADSPSLRAMREMRTVKSPHVRDQMIADPRREALRAILGAMADFDSALSVPMIYHEKPLGVLTANYPRGYDPDDKAVDFLGAIADQAAVVIVNARLFEDAQSLAALEERQRLARELHDSVSQSLYGIGLGARTARALIEANPPAAAKPLDYILELTEAGLAEMRALVFELRADSLEREGLVAAFEKQAAAMRARHGLRIELRAMAEPDVPLRVKEALYRVVMEALHNVVKHAHATAAAVVLRVVPSGLCAEVTDNGRGFDPSVEFPGHLGLVSMRQRVAALGGTLEVESGPNRGTTLRAIVPVAGG